MGKRGQKRLVSRQSGDYAYCRKSDPPDSPLLPPATCGHGTAVCCLPNSDYPNGATVVCVHGAGTVWSVCAPGETCVPGFGSSGPIGCQPTSGSQLSAGAIAGIVIGSVAGAALLALAGLWAYRKRSASRPQGVRLEDEGHPNDAGAAEDGQDGAVAVAAAVKPGK